MSTHIQKEILEKFDNDLKKVMSALALMSDEQLRGEYRTTATQAVQYALDENRRKAHEDALQASHEASIAAFKALIEKERQVPVEIPHGSPYLSGYNAALDDLLASLDEKNQ